MMFFSHDDQSICFLELVPLIITADAPEFNSQFIKSEKCLLISGCALLPQGRERAGVWGMVDVLFGHATGRAAARPCHISCVWMLLMFLPELLWRDLAIDVFPDREDVGTGSVGQDPSLKFA